MKRGRFGSIQAYLALLLFFYVLISGCSARGGEGTSNSPADLFGPNVVVFGPGSQNMQDTISGIYATQMSKSNEFDEARYAILFLPGQYNLDVRVGYYTQVAGL